MYNDDDIPETHDPEAIWASVEEAIEEIERERTYDWEMWFRMVASNYPECEGF